MALLQAAFALALENVIFKTVIILGKINNSELFAPPPKKHGSQRTKMSDNTIN
jgi:hypothetical protein